MQHRVTSDEILRTIQELMKGLFDLDAERVHPEARLVEDLGLDSIDAIDLAAKVEEATGRALDEASLRSLRTIEDVIRVVEMLLAGAPSKERIPA
jgi:acyl carrier protein